MANDEHPLRPEERSLSSLTPFADLAGDRQVHLLGCVEMPTFEQALTHVANAAGAFPGDVFGVIQALISRGLADREEHGRVERPSLAGDRLRPVLAEHGYFGKWWIRTTVSPGLRLRATMILRCFWGDSAYAKLTAASGVATEPESGLPVPVATTVAPSVPVAVTV